MKILFFSTVIVGLSEMGDKTQWLAFSLASHYRRPWAVFGGILIASLLGHALAAYVGSWVGQHFDHTSVALFLGACLIAFALWTVRPQPPERGPKHFGVSAFFSTIGLFLLAEMGDKTQLATAALAAKYQSPILVTAGSTLGMLLADALAIFLGDRLANKIPMRTARWVSASVFLIFGVVTLTSPWLQ